MTEPPLGSVPLRLPTLPVGVGCRENQLAPHGGEWFYVGHDRPQTKGCTGYADYPGDPQEDLSRLRRVVLYFHGGAYCLCSSKTHRLLCFHIVDKTGLPLLIDLTSE